MTRDFNHHIGLTSELTVASYFSSLGYDIYWPLKTQSKCDFLIEKDRECLKIQVKTATWQTTTKTNFKYLQCRVCTSNEWQEKFYSDEDFDFIVFVDGHQLWIAHLSEIKGLTSVCLGSDNPNYKIRTDLYDPNKWKIPTH